MTYMADIYYIFKYYITILCSLPIPDLHNAPNNSTQDDNGVNVFPSIRTLNTAAGTRQA